MKIVKYIISGVALTLSFPAMADLLPPPDPPHKIGYAICVAATSMLAILGFVFMRYIGRRR